MAAQQMARQSRISLGVLSEDSTILTNGGARLRLPATFDDPAQLLDGCVRHGLTQLWCHPAWPDVTNWRGGADRWDVQYTCPAPWSHCFERGTSHEVELIFPELNRDDPWRAAQSARELLAGLEMFHAATGRIWWRSGGTTARRLLEHMHTRHPNALPLTLPGEMPAPALAHGIEPPASWIRRLGAEERIMRYIHSYDKNGAYLGACASLDVGAGAVEHISQEGIEHLTDKELRLPGYWLVTVDEGTAIPAIGPRTGKRAGLPTWVTTATLRLLIARGMSPALIGEAYIWREHHQPLKGWYEVLRDGRMCLLAERAQGREGAALALDALKAMYKAFCGGYLKADGWDRTGDALYRPDWRHAIMGTARCNLVRRADKCIKDDAIWPLALGGVDGLYIVSNEPDPVRAAPASITLGDTLADFKPNPPVPLASVRELLESDLPSHKRVAGLVAAMTERKYAGKVAVTC